jgi:hypothetical protein
MMMNGNELMSGAEYMESLRDGRAVYLYGERIGDVTTHPAFRNSVRSVARLYDMLVDPGQRDLYVFIAPMDTPGTRLICRPSYEQNAHSPFDHPLSSRFDENDAVLIFDEAFIPWENFLVYRNVERPIPSILPWDSRRRKSSPLSRKTANFVGLAQLRSRRPDLQRNESERFNIRPVGHYVISTVDYTADNNQLTVDI